jgi:hypothetical protein
MKVCVLLRLCENLNSGRHVKQDVDNWLERFEFTQTPKLQVGNPPPTPSCLATLPAQGTVSGMQSPPCYFSMAKRCDRVET